MCVYWTLSFESSLFSSSLTSHYKLFKKKKSHTIITLSPIQSTNHIILRSQKNSDCDVKLFCSLLLVIPLMFFDFRILFYELWLELNIIKLLLSQNWRKSSSYGFFVFLFFSFTSSRGSLIKKLNLYELGWV